jgi:hypothetical protein
LTEAEARHLLLVRAVEMQDTAGALFTAEDRRQASAAGLQAASGGARGRGARGREDGEARFLAGRSEFAFARLATRAPALAQADRRARWPAALGWALPALALALGVATNEIGGGGRLNIIAFPLLGMLAWNLAVYAALLAGRLQGLGRAGPERMAGGPFARLLRWATHRALSAGGDGAVQGRAIAQFAGDWLSAASALNGARIGRTLHLSAAALAAGVLLGMYARALGVEYRAGWESTFLDAPTLHRVLHLVLAPASRLTGVALPTRPGWRRSAGGPADPARTRAIGSISSPPPRPCSSSGPGCCWRPGRRCGPGGSPGGCRRPGARTSTCGGCFGTRATWAPRCGWSLTASARRRRSRRGSSAC